MTFLNWLLPKLAGQQAEELPPPVDSPYGNGPKADFFLCVSRVLEHEGGYVNHPDDPGGATNYGITQAVARKHGYMGDMRNLSRDKAMAIYRSDYWDASHAAMFPQALAFQYFDACVNHGLNRGAKLLQLAVGSKPDGIIGPATIEAAHEISDAQAVLLFNQERIKFYTGLSTFKTFGKGWMNRISQNLAWGANDVG